MLRDRFKGIKLDSFGPISITSKTEKGVSFDSERAKLPRLIPWLVPKLTLMVLSISEGCAIEAKLTHLNSH